MVDCKLQRAEVFLKNQFIGLFNPTSIQLMKVFICTCRLFYPNSKSCIKYMYRLGNSQRLPRAMHALGKECVDLLFQKEYADLRVEVCKKFDGFNFDCLFENHQKRQNFPHSKFCTMW